MERQSDRAHGPSKHRDQGGCAQDGKKPTLRPSRVHIRDHVTAPKNCAGITFIADLITQPHPLFADKVLVGL
jgi:hypothetical protein